MTYRHQLTGKRFKLGSQISWTSQMSAAEATWEQENQGEIVDIDYQNKTVRVKLEAEERYAHVESAKIEDVLVF